MHRSISLKLLLLFLGAAIAALFVLLVLSPPAHVAVEQPSLHTPGSPGIPVRLMIPAISVNAAVEAVGLTDTGAVGVPEGPSNAAWLDVGPLPGEEGSAVIDGHFGWKNGIPAVFDNLSKLHTGDKLYVENDAGVTTTFVVREIRTYGEKEDAARVFSSADGKAHLNLITCEGVWNAAQKSYSDRLVVFTDKV